MYIINLIKHKVSSYLAHSGNITGNKIIDDELEKNGCVVIEDFISAEKCNKLIQIGKKVMLENPNLVKSESNNSDLRVYSVDSIEKDFSLQSETIVIDSWAKKFYRTNEIKHFQMLGYIRCLKDNLGSGGGWHRDSPFRHQFKFILYLSDVEEKNGPFQYIKGTHKERKIFKYCRKLGHSLSKFRFSDQEVEKICKEIPENEILTITGKAGTLLIADVKGLHRGKPLLDGERWATTRYYFKNKIPAHLIK